MDRTAEWTIAGSYYESCNCRAVCPCRRLNGAPGARSTYGLCQFVLSWRILEGHSGPTPLSGTSVALAGFYDNDVPGEPWSIKLFLDDGATDAQYDMLQTIFLGQADGNMPFTSYFGTILEVKRAALRLDHTKDHEVIRIGAAGGAKVLRRAGYEGTVTCGIPGHDHPGTESVSDLDMNDPPLVWDYAERCGFATDFHYHS